MFVKNSHYNADSMKIGGIMDVHYKKKLGPIFNAMDPVVMKKPRNSEIGSTHNMTEEDKEAKRKMIEVVMHLNREKVQFNKISVLRKRVAVEFVKIEERGSSVNPNMSLDGDD